ncbi:MAG: hypothetical protein KDC38_17135, partial [Planctomycetes bacterium]|nr:hypothetical protein [Planctomycetota bacterium]
MDRVPFDDAMNTDPIEDCDVDHEERIRGRLAELVKDHTQAGIARVTAAPQSSVSRYLRERRIPAEFCAKLAAGLEVRPEWLLLGRGPRYVVDGSREGSLDAVVDLARALDAVGNMTLLSVAGDKSREQLWKLRRSLDRVDELQQRLCDEYGPMFHALHREFIESFRRSDLDHAERTLETLSELVRLLRSPTFETVYLHSRAFLLDHRGRLDEALAVHRQVVRRVIGEPLSSGTRNMAVNFLRLLFKTFRLAEASRIARALIALDEDQADIGEHWELEIARAMCALEMGDVAGGTQGLAVAFPRIGAEAQRIWRVNQLVALFLQGGLPYAEVLSIADRETREHGNSRKAAARTLALHALAIESMDELSRLTEHFGSE